MATQLKSKQASKGVRLGWIPLDEVKDVKLNFDLLKGKKISENPANEESPSANSLLVP